MERREKLGQGREDGREMREPCDSPGAVAYRISIFSDPSLPRAAPTLPNR